MKKYFEPRKEWSSGPQRLILTERGFSNFIKMNAERSSQEIRQRGVEVRRLQQEYAQQELSRDKLEKLRNDRYSRGARGNRSVDDLGSPEGVHRVGAWNRGGFLKSVIQIVTDRKKNG